LDRVLIVGGSHLRAVLAEYQGHYNTARPHLRKPVLGGLINEYAHAARDPPTRILRDRRMALLSWS
jgi:hypothetical protein